MRIRNTQTGQEVRQHVPQAPVQQAAPERAYPARLCHQLEVRQIDERVLLDAGRILRVGHDHAMRSGAENAVPSPGLPELSGGKEKRAALAVRHGTRFRQLVQTQVDSLPEGIHRRNVVDNRNQQILRIAAGRRVGRTVEKLLKQPGRNVFALIVPYGAAPLEQRIQLAGLRDIARKRRAIRGCRPHNGNSPRRADRKAVLTADTVPFIDHHGVRVHAESLMQTIFDASPARNAQGLIHLEINHDCLLGVLPSGNSIPALFRKGVPFIKMPFKYK